MPPSYAGLDSAHYLVRYIYQKTKITRINQLSHSLEAPPCTICYDHLGMGRSLGTFSNEPNSWNTQNSAWFVFVPIMTNCASLPVNWHPKVAFPEVSVSMKKSHRLFSWKTSTFAPVVSYSNESSSAKTRERATCRVQGAHSVMAQRRCCPMVSSYLVSWCFMCFRTGL